MTDYYSAPLIRVWGDFTIGAAYEGSYHLGNGELPGFLGRLYGTAFIKDVVDGGVYGGAVFCDGYFVELTVALDSECSTFNFFHLKQAKAPIQK